MLAIAAATVDGVDAAALDHSLREGEHRHAIFDDLESVRSGAVRMTPHLFVPDGTDVTNPGITVRWQGEWAKGFPVIDADDRSAVEALVARASSVPLRAGSAG